MRYSKDFSNAFLVPNSLFENISFMNNNYGYNRKKLMLPEYGRHVHHMVDYLISIEDRVERTHQAEVVVQIMKNINTSLKDSDDVMHSIWDHLHIISDFNLDVDSPYQKPSPDIVNITPQQLEYPSKEFTMKHYGKNIKKIIKVVAKLDEQAEDKDIVSTNIAKFMQIKSLEFNHEHPNNGVILNDLKLMSENSIILDESTLNNIKTEYKQNHFKKVGKKQNPQNNNKISTGMNRNYKTKYKSSRM